MFKDLFDFGKTRSLKESIGFFIFYSTIIMAVYGVMTLLGTAS